MTQVLDDGTITGGGTRQQRAAQLRAELEAQETTASPNEQVDPQPTGATDQAPVSADESQPADAPGTGPVGQGEIEVGQGDCISSIAHRTGHLWETIWNDPANAELQQARQDPNVLLPKDRVTIPALRQKQESGETEMRHRFVRRGEPARIHLRLIDEDDKPRANEAFTLVVDSEQYTGTTAADGTIDQIIPANARTARLRVGEDQDEYVLNLGTVDPCSEISGAQNRLNNLDYGCGSPDGRTNLQTRQAIGLFQQDQGLEQTEALDESTKQQLKNVSGG